MLIHVDQATLNVSPSFPLTVNDGGGRSLRVLEGRVWITQQGSLDDVFLVAGESYALDGMGATVVTAENADKTASVVAFDSPLTIRASDLSHGNWFDQLKHTWTTSAA